MLKIAICDDETAFLTELSAMLRSWAASRELVLQLFPFTNGDKLIAACEESPADLVILDIMMPFPGGMDTAKALRGGLYAGAAGFCPVPVPVDPFGRG